LSVVLNRYDAAYAAAEEAIRSFTASSNAHGKADAQRWAGRASFYLGHPDEGTALLEAALATHRQLRSRSLGATLRDLAVTRGAAGDVERSRQLFAEALYDFECHEDEGAVAQTAATLAGVEFHAGNVDTALEIAAKALEAARGLKRYRMMAWILGEMATFSIARGAFGDARLQARESLAIADRQSWDLDAAFALQHLAAIAALHDDAAAAAQREPCIHAARLLGFVDARLAQLHTTRESAERQEYERARAALVAALGEETFARGIAEGATLTADQAVALGMTM
jgi:tetratricopeptide (TPR) repeat protein